MVKIRGWDEKTMIHPNDTELEEIIKNGYKDDKCLKETVGISFPTCNYRTYIIRMGNLYLVSTCNNHNFEDKIKHITQTLTKKTKIIINNLYNNENQYGDENENALYQIRYYTPRHNVFWIADCDIYGHLPKSDHDFCMKCRESYHYILNVGIACPNCKKQI